MIRRTLQFVLMLAVLVSASAAQAYAMPCCHIAPAAVAAAVSVTTPASDEAATMHCHGMGNMSAPPVTLSLTSCPAPACTVHADLATANTEDTALIPALHVTLAPFGSRPDQPAVPTAISRGQLHPPGLDKTAHVPLRV